MNLGFIQSRESMITYSYFLHTREGGVMGGKRKEVVTFTMPEGDTITVVLVDLGDKGVTMEPVSANPNKVHHHKSQDSSGNLEFIDWRPI
jgi:hypothetical protein